LYFLCSTIWIIPDEIGFFTFIIVSLIGDIKEFCSYRNLFPDKVRISCGIRTLVSGECRPDIIFLAIRFKLTSSYYIKKMILRCGKEFNECDMNCVHTLHNQSRIIRRTIDADVSRTFCWLFKPH
jgi:hypothetical protein